ncbi:MAG: CBS domain-containing protein [Anaerolineae bacterium]
MLVKDYMTRHPIMISPTTSAAEAQKLMVESKVRHLPVVGDGKRLLGLVTRERLRIPPTDLGSLNVWEISRLLSHLTVQDVMLKGDDLLTTDPDATLEDAAKIMVDHKVGSLPVLEEGIVVGIITEVDMLVQLAELLGAYVPGVRVMVRVPNRIGETAKITSAIASQGWGIYASGSGPAPKDPDSWDIVLKVRGAAKEAIVAALEKIDGLEVIDVREQT